MYSFEGDTGPYLQYAHARISSIIRKANIPVEQLVTADLSLLEEKHAVNLVRSLAQWPDVFLNTYKTREPITVLTYLFRMTHLLSSSYDHLQVVGSAEPLKRARMALYYSARQVLGNGMRLLGLTPVDRYVSLHPFPSLSLFTFAMAARIRVCICQLPGLLFHSNTTLASLSGRLQISNKESSLHLPMHRSRWTTWQ